MALPTILQNLSLPVICSPMFIAGNPRLVAEQCKAGVHGNYLKHSVINAGFDPLNLPKSDPSKMNFGTGGGAEKKVWRDIWSAGQGVGQIKAIMPVAEVVAQLTNEYVAARQRLQLG